MIEPVENNQEVVAENVEKERGASMVEYVLLVALIAVVCIGIVTTLGTTIQGKFSEAQSGIA